MTRDLSDHQPLTLSGLGELLVCETGINPSRLVDRLIAIGVIERQSRPTGRREVQLTLTTDGRSLARRIAKIEENVYRLIGTASQSHNTEAVLGFLRDFVAELPSGRALARRVELSESKPRVA